MINLKAEQEGEDREEDLESIQKSITIGATLKALAADQRPI